MDQIRQLCWLVVAVFFALAPAGVASGQTLTASTTVTVVTVDNWIHESTKSPSEAEFYEVTVDLWNVRYAYDSICWDWSPRDWPQGSTQLNGRIWKFFSENNGVTYSATSWDYISANHTCKARAAAVPAYWIGMMLSSLCHTPPQRPFLCRC